MTKLALIVAVARNNVIGAGNAIPWHCPADLQYFKRTTMGAPVMMGRKTWDSLQIKPLPGRQNIIVSRDLRFTAEECEVVNSIEEGLQLAANAKRVFVIGGEDIYKQVLHKADELYITYVDADVEGDRYFPQFSLQDWEQIREESYSADDKNLYDMVFRVYQKS